MIFAYTSPSKPLKQELSDVDTGGRKRTRVTQKIVIPTHLSKTNEFIILSGNEFSANFQVYNYHPYNVCVHTMKQGVG